MTETTDNLLKQFHFVGHASRAFMRPEQARLTGQNRVLALLLIEDGIIQNNLAEILDVRPSSLAELIKKMEIAGDVKRLEDEADKRSKHIYLTDDGRTKAEKLTASKPTQTSAEFFAGLSEAEQTELSGLLDKVAAGWSEDFKQQAGHFFDPFDRMKAMQAFREKMVAAYPGDWHDLSADERRKLKKKMQEEFRKEFSGMERGRRGHGPGCGRGGRGGHHGGPNFAGADFAEAGFGSPGFGGPGHGPERGHGGKRRGFDRQGDPDAEFFKEFFARDQTKKPRPEQ